MSSTPLTQDILTQLTTGGIVVVVVATSTALVGDVIESFASDLTPREERNDRRGDVSIIVVACCWVSVLRLLLSIALVALVAALESAFALLVRVCFIMFLLDEGIRKKHK